MQMDSVGELFSRLKQRNVHTLIQTAGLFTTRYLKIWYCPTPTPSTLISS